VLNRLALLMLCVCSVLLTGCAGHVQQEQDLVVENAKSTPHEAAKPAFTGRLVAVQEEEVSQSASAPVVELSFAQRAQAVVQQFYQIPQLAGTVLERGFELLGTPYRYGGSTLNGFDCSGFVSFLFREEAGIDLPRSTREMIQLDAPKVARHELQPGDILFFNDRGRGQVSHTGIYIGEDQFIHSSSRKSGGVRVDSLDDRYWGASYIQAKRVLAKTPDA
jgi:cell wall-associated NlpC family hydrolase